jgi:protein-L-isoaspartate(D-aspartate) O-methyltransferase
MGRDARRLHRQLVDQLVRSGAITDPRVEEAFRAVPRQVFLPGVPAERAYADEAIVTRRDPHGQPISSSSQPTIMALMLGQLDVQHGHRVLELGAGTGYHAALLARLALAGGRVTTVDLDDEITAEAKARLRDAGVRGVRVRTGDGWDGWPSDAPFDRVIATVGVDDVAPAWVAQLAPGGRIVAPLWLRAGFQLAVALEPEDGGMVATSVLGCGFMRLRGPHAGLAAYVDARGWTVSVDGGEAETARALDAALAEGLREEPVARAPQRWELRLLLDEPDAVAAFPRGTTRPLPALLTVDPPGFAVIDGAALRAAGAPQAAARLRAAAAHATPLTVDRLRLRVVPHSDPLPDAQWVLERRDHVLLLDEHRS